MKPNEFKGLNIASRQMTGLRARDAYFDAVCEVYEDLEAQIADLEKSPSAKRTDLETLKSQRESSVDTILFMLDDRGLAHRLAA